MRTALATLVVIALAAVAFAAPALLEALACGPIEGSVVLVVTGLALACAASESTSASAVASGALGAWVAAMVGLASPVAAGATLLLAAYADRVLRGRGSTARAAQAILALIAGALGAAIVEGHASSPAGIRLVALGVASVLATLPRLVDADDAIAHALDGIAARVPEPSRTVLANGAELRRSVRDVPLARDAALRVRRTWRSLLTLAEARLRLERARRAVVTPARFPTPAPVPAPARGTRPTDAVVAMVERRLAEHVTALTRAYDAADSARAAELGLDDADLRGTENVGDALEDVSDALVDLQS